VRDALYARKAGRAVGQMFFAGFGSLWIMGWCQGTRGTDWPMLALIAMVGSMLFLWALCDFRAYRRAAGTSADPAADKARNRVFGWVNLVQWSAVFAANIGLNAAGRPEWVAPAVILIVGLHFFPLARLFKTPFHYVMGIAMVIVALAYPWMAGGGAEYTAGEFATGAILWFGALYGFLRDRFAETPAVAF
jgi:hypothetical protein